MNKSEEKRRAAEEAFTALYGEYRAQVYKFCLAKLLPDSRSAEDCMQNTFVVLYQRLLKGETFDYPRAFLYKTANNFVLKCLHDKQRRQTENISLEEHGERLSASLAQPDERLAYEELEQTLLSLLTEEEQALFRLRFIEGEDIGVIAARLGISGAAAAKRLSRIRQKIKRYIDYEERRGE